MLVYWIRNGRPTTLVLVALLGAACLLVRANIFIWLAPTLVLSVVVGIRKLSKVQRFLTIVTGLAMLCAFLIIISWEHIHADPANFLFSYIEFVHLNQPPTNYQGLYSRLMAAMGRGGQPRLVSDCFARYIRTLVADFCLVLVSARWPKEVCCT